MNQRIQFRNYFTGILVSITGAFLWALLILTIHAVNEKWSGLGAIIVAAYAVIYTSWFVIPIGFGVGYLLPRLVSAKPRQAILRGVLLGIGCGLVAAFLTSLMNLWPELNGTATIVNSAAWQRDALTRFAGTGLSMSIVSGIFLGAWAFIIKQKTEKRRKISIYFMLAIAVIAGVLLAPLATFQRIDATELFSIGFAVGAAGAVLLFLSQLPHYRQQRLLALGPLALDRFHRRLYWLANLAIAASILFFLTVWLKMK